MANPPRAVSLDWNDSSLVAAYDKAAEKCRHYDRMNNVCSISENKKTGTSRHRNTHKEPEYEWVVGDYCRSVFSEDGKIYEAEVILVNEKEHTCFINYVGYNNDEKVFLRDLMPSAGSEARMMQKTGVNADVIRTWTVGEFCQAVHAADGQLYEAVVEEVWPDYCVVKFIGYGDVEEVDFVAMHPSEGTASRLEQQRRAEWAKRHIRKPQNISQSSTESNKLSSRKMSSSSDSNHEETSETGKLDDSSLGCDGMTMSRSTCQEHSTRSCASNKHRNACNCKPFIPPMPSIFDDDDANGNQVLSDMVMAWYVAGYQTGYYQGLKDGQELHCDEESCRRED